MSNSIDKNRLKNELAFSESLIKGLGSSSFSRHNNVQQNVAPDLNRIPLSESEKKEMSMMADIAAEIGGFKKPAPSAPIKKQAILEDTLGINQNRIDSLLSECEESISLIPREYKERIQKIRQFHDASIRFLESVIKRNLR